MKGSLAPSSAREGEQEQAWQHIVTKCGRRTAMRYWARFGILKPSEGSEIASHFLYWKALHGQSVVSSGHTAFTVMRPAKVRAFNLLALHGAEQSCCEGSCQGSELVFIQNPPPPPPPPTVNQLCQCGGLHITLYNYKIWAAHSDAVCSSIWPSQDSRASAIAQILQTELSNHICKASINWLLAGPHFQIKHKLAFRVHCHQCECAPRCLKIQSVVRLSVRRLLHVCSPQEVGGTFIGENGLVLMAGVERCQIHQNTWFLSVWFHLPRSSHYYESSSTVAYPLPTYVPADLVWHACFTAK